MSAALSLSLQMINSQTSGCITCLVLIFLTLCYLCICVFPLFFLIFSLLASLSPSLPPRWKSFYRHSDRFPGHRCSDLSQPRRQPRAPHSQARLQMVPRYFWKMLNQEKPSARTTSMQIVKFVLFITLWQLTPFVYEDIFCFVLFFGRVK